MNSTKSEAPKFRMPVLFIGHGSPMNAIEKNEFSDNWASIAHTLPKPESILCISAHWETNGTAITAMPNPKTIHDFGGFPKELYEVQYPAPGNPKLAEEIINKVTKFNITPDFNWGFDHGSWSVLRCMYSKADIPLVQLSIDRTQPLSFHYELAKALHFLREKQVLIVGSGNIVHNLRMIEWQNEGGAEWAKIANDKLKKLIINNQHQALIDYKNLGKEIQLAIPTNEHYIPLLFILALKQAEDEISFFNDKLRLGSLSMTSIIIK